MSETRKIAAILVSDVVGYSRLAGADEEGTLARLRALRSDLIDPTISVHHGRVVKRTGDGSVIEFRSVVDAVRCLCATCIPSPRVNRPSATCSRPSMIAPPISCFSPRSFETTSDMAMRPSHA
jgi:class 3 adenylate cyclase